MKMSLGLVNYEDSDESDNDTQVETDCNVINTNKNTSFSQDARPISSKYKNSDQFNSQLITEVTSVYKIDLQPVDNPAKKVDLNNEENDSIKESKKPVNFHLPESKIGIFNTDFDIKCLTSTNKPNGPVRITIPSLDKVEDNLESPPEKKLKPSQKGSGLFALLPSPKNLLLPNSLIRKSQAMSSTNSKRLLPLPLVGNKSSAESCKKQVIPNIKNKNAVLNTSAVNSSLINYDDSEDESEPSEAVDFFSLESKKDVLSGSVDANLEISCINTLDNRTTMPVEINSIPSQDVCSLLPSNPPSMSQSPYTYSTSDFMSVSSKDLELDQQAMQQLCGRKDRFKMQEVNIIDVSGDAIMPDSRDWLTKQLTEERSQMTSHKKKDGPTTQQKRKHQITYLAFQAKENELELKNQWANNRMSRKQTQAKYGF